MQVSSGRDSELVFLSNINTFLARVKSASVGDASLYDGAHNSDIPVLGSDTFSLRYHRCVDVVLAFQ